jgi:hypothetical protein
MAASIYKSSDLSSATYGTPDVSGLIVKSFTKSQSAAVSEVKDDQGSVIAVAVAEPVVDISIEGMRTGSFSATVGGLLAITIPDMPTGGTSIVTKMDTKYQAEQFESVSLSVKHYGTAMSS